MREKLGREGQRGKGADVEYVLDIIHCILTHRCRIALRQVAIATSQPLRNTLVLSKFFLFSFALCLLLKKMTVVNLRYGKIV